MLDLSVGRKLSLVIEHLERDGEIELEGYVYILDADNNLYTKGKSYKAGEDYMDPNVGSDVYFNANDTSIKYLFNQLDKLDDEFYFGLMANNALRKINKSR